MPQFSYLVRFVADDGKVYFGDADPPKDGRFSSAKVIEGDIFGDFQITDTRKAIKELLAPVSRETTHVIRGVGFNYHGIPEAVGMKTPEYPVLFFRPVTGLAGPYEDLKIEPVAQEPGLDSEAELVVVIGKEARDVSEEDALNYVLGYTVGNDLTHHEWVNRGKNASLGKHFDGWCPVGPAIVPTSTFKDVTRDVHIRGKINGQQIQEGTSDGMIFSIPWLISFLSRGVTLLPGDILLSGTPPGARGLDKPPVWLKHGDVIEFTIDNVGTIVNKVVFT